MIPLAILCVAGIVLSSSREALIGLLAGATLLATVRLRDVILPATAVGAALMAVVLAFPSVVRRLDPSGYAADENLLGRIEAWRFIIPLIAQSPVYGFGMTNPTSVAFVDNAYLGFLLVGGLVGLTLWLLGIAAITPPLLRPLTVAMLTIGLLGNPFGGPTLALFLIACAATWERSASRSGTARSGSPSIPSSDVSSTFSTAAIGRHSQPISGIHQVTRWKREGPEQSRGHRVQ
jgi:hypothetical protein